MSTSARPSNRSAATPTLSSGHHVLGRHTVARTLRLSFGTSLVAGIAFITLAAFGTQSAMAATATVNLGTASSFAVLAGSEITNTGPTTISGDIGLSPGTAISGFPPGSQTSGATYVANGVALTAENDLITASNSAASRSPYVTVSGDLGGSTLVSGVYRSTSSMGLTGTVTLNGAGNPDAVFIFEAGSTLTTATTSTVVLENGAQACNVFWQVGSSATLGTTTNFAGSILASTSITLNTGATVNGRVLALGGAVTMDDNTITVPTCLLASSTTTTAVSATSTTAVSTTSTTPVSTTSTTAVSATSTTAVSTTSTTAVSATSTTAVSTTSTTLKAGTSGGTPVTRLTSSVTTTTTPLPLGAPETGAGGAARSVSSLLLPIGLVALGLAGVSGPLIVRARRARKS
jgi:hypothetical protein